MQIIIQSFDFNFLLILLLTFPLASALLSAMTGKSDRLRNRLLRHAALVGASAALFTMGLVVYRRFRLPLGAMQLHLDWGDWFSVPPLTAGIYLRMDTEAGILCSVAIAGTLMLQIINTFRGRDPRIRGAINAILCAALLFILADNLVPVIAALAAIGPLAAITALKSRDDSDYGNRSARLLLTHGIGNALALLGLFLIFGALGAMDYQGIAREAAAYPPSQKEAALGIAVLLFGVGFRTGPGLLNALCPSAAAVYLAYRLDVLVKTLPSWVVMAAAILMGTWAIVNIALTVLETAKTGRFLPDFSSPLHGIAGSFFDDFLDRVVFYGGMDKMIRIPQHIGNFIASKSGGFRGKLYIALAGVVITAGVYLMVGPWRR